MTCAAVGVRLKRRLPAPVLAVRFPRLMLMVMMSEVIRILPAFVLAETRRHCPRKLQAKSDDHEDLEQALHRCVL